MYWIWAAAISGIRVISSRPEPQNYALSNHNIFIKGLSERISAYCMPVARKVGFDKFYLSHFKAGDSCYAFGAQIRTGGN